MLDRTKILPLQKDKILSQDPQEMLSYIKVLIGALSRMYQDIAAELVPTYEESLTWNPANLTSGSSVTSSDITLPDAELGDYVQVGAPYDLQGLLCSGYVQKADTVNIVLSNHTGGDINLAEGTWTVKLTKRRL